MQRIHAALLTSVLLVNDDYNSLDLLVVLAKELFGTRECLTLGPLPSLGVSLLIGAHACAGDAQVVRQDTISLCWREDSGGSFVGGVKVEQRFACVGAALHREGRQEKRSGCEGEAHLEVEKGECVVVVGKQASKGKSHRCCETVRRGVGPLAVSLTQREGPTAQSAASLRSFRHGQVVSSSSQRSKVDVCVCL